MLLRNAANTGFDAKVDYATGSYPESVSVGDFNNDGKLDLAVANYSSSTVSVLLRNAANTGFDAIVDYATGSPVSWPRSVSVGDFNNDGKNDLAVANEGDHTVSVLLNNSNPAATLTIADAPPNTAPTVLAGTTTAFTEQMPVPVTSTITVNDADGDADWNGGTLQVQITANANADDSLTLPTAKYGGIWLDTGNVLMADATVIGLANAATVSNGTAWIFRFNDLATNALVQDTARTIQFVNNSDTPSTTNRTVTFTATDKNTSTHSDTQTVSVTAVNDAPTLTVFSAPVSTGNEDSEITVSFADLQTQGDEADMDGAVTAFVIKAVSSGTLKIGLSAATATAWSASSNNTVDATHQAYWTPAANANGSLNAFTAVAKDDGGLESVTPVQATVSVTAVPDVNISAGTNPVEGGTTGTFTVTLDSPAPAGGLTINYALAGTATLNTDYTVTAGSHISGVTGSSFTIAEDEISAVLNVNAATDAISDPDETVVLNLTTGIGYQYVSSVATFAPKVDYATGLNSTSINVGDFNNDGKLDLAVANSASNTVSVLLRNTANTGFDAKVDYAVGEGPHWVSAGDFNNDGKLDLAVANVSMVSVLLRNAANTGFDAKVDYATGFNASSVSVGDFNHDGKLDLAVANYSGSVSVLLRNAANTGFDTHVDYAIGFYPGSVSVGDFNNDGKLDLAVANEGSDTVSVLLRNAANTGFDAKVAYSTGSYPESVSVGDFNNDGKTDLAVANFIGSVSVLLNNSNPDATLTITDTPFNTVPTVLAGATTAFTEQMPVAVTSMITVNDTDGDADWNGGTLQVQITANATADDRLTLHTINNGGIWLNTTGNALMADATVIGLANAATVSNGTAWTFRFNDLATNALVQDTARTIQFTNNSDAPSTTDRTVTFTATDKNTGTNSTTQTVSVTAVNDAPTLSVFAAAVASGNEDSQMTVSFADLQAQGDETDVDGTVTAFIVKAVSSGTLKIGTSAATASAWSASSNNTVDATNQAYWTPAANANGTLNAFTSVAKDNGGLESVTPVQVTVSVTAVPDVNVTAGVTPVEGGTTGTFIVTLDSPAPAGGLTVNYALAGTATLSTDYTVTAGSNITAMTSSSFNIAAGQSSATLNINAATDAISDPNETVKLSLTTGTGYQLAQSNVTTFAPKVDYATGLYPESVSVGDFNNDGKLDLAVANVLSDTVSVLLRNAANTGFDAKVDYATGEYPYSVSVGDFNNDGKVDLAVANWYSNTVSVLLRNADNTGFDAKVDVATGLTPWAVSVGDFNNDGKVDLAVANRDSNTVSVLLRNATNNGFDAKVDYATGVGPSSVSAGDFNNDGKLDLAVANLGLSSVANRTVSVLLRNTDNTGFDDKVDYATGIIYSVSVGDFNNDGKADLAVANGPSNMVSVLLNDSNPSDLNHCE